MKTPLLFILVMAISMVSCKKDNEEKNCPVTASSIAGSYKLSAFKYKQSASAQEDNWMPVIESCKQDDVYNLTAAMGFSIQDAGTVCSPSGDYPNGSWTLESNVINMDGFYSGTIESFDCTNLTFYQTDVLVTGDRLTATFSKQ
ncbi:MAG TPA: hypothetical protein VFX58_20130 [Chitinophagaceae bacterium]|nr:hypothetical protein [Chitinophagaceae bacterium]